MQTLSVPGIVMQTLRWAGAVACSAIAIYWLYEYGAYFPEGWPSDVFDLGMTAVFTFGAVSFWRSARH
jgi:hypothetical protein